MISTAYGGFALCTLWSVDTEFHIDTAQIIFYRVDCSTFFKIYFIKKIFYIILSTFLKLDNIDIHIDVYCTLTTVQ
jgi:hypothetical protein